MNCNQCGYLLAEDETVCPACGNKAIGASVSEAQVTPPASLNNTVPDSMPEVQTNSSFPSPKAKDNPLMKSMIFGVVGMAIGAAVLFAIFMINGIVGADADKIEGRGYDAPEEAAEAYLIALRDQDVDAMISTFAVESYVENYDFNAMIERLQAYVPNMEMPFPGSTPYTKDLNLESRRKFITQNISNQYFYYNELIEDYSFGLSNTLKDYPDLVEDMEKATKDYYFEDLEITGSMDPEDISDIYKDERNQKNLADQVKIYGVKKDEVANVVITFEVAGDEYIFCPQLIEYNGRWYIQSLQGNLANLIGLGYVAGGIAPYPLPDSSPGV
ncbi:MAG: hypothetical protein GXY06_06245 [Clostridiaceae bacterium]|nr:hypothetical protein [Clostridiaceae bacterium]